MSVSEIRMPAIIAWIFFVPGLLFIVVDITDWNLSGLAVLGVVFLALWFWLIGGFTRAFWLQDDVSDEPTGLDVLEQEGHR